MIPALITAVLVSTYCNSSEIPEKREFPVNESVNPCNNFYFYTCSKVIDGFKLRQDRSTHTFAFNDSYERLLEHKKKFMESLASVKDISPRGMQLKNNYIACMDKSASIKEEKYYVEKTINELKDIKSNKQLQEFFGDKTLTGEFAFILFDTDPDLDNPDVNDFVSLATLKILPERSYYSNPDVVKDYKDVIADLFKTLKFDNTEERANAVFEFEKKFAQTYPLPVELREIFNDKTKYTTRADFLKKYPNLRLQKLLNKVPANTRLRDLTPANYAALNRQLAETPIETLKDVYLFHALYAYMDDAYPDFFNKKFAFKYKHLGGPKVRPDRQERCTRSIMENFDRELDAELLPRIFPNSPKQRIVAIVEMIRSSILDGLKNNKWLSKQSKDAATSKIKAVRFQLVQPDTEKDWDFKPITTYSPDKPITNTITFQKMMGEKALKEMAEPRNKNKWGMGPLTINAYYDFSDNKFVLPIGILQYPFFDEKLSNESLLGGIGAVIAHEIGHGIDDEGSKYDYQGRLKQWMPKKDLSKFKKRGEKLIEQFNAIGHNGKLTLGENIADLVGVTFAYHAAFPKNKGSIQEKKNFFLGWGRVWCEIMLPKYREKLLKTDPHSLGEARVNEQVKQQKGFAEAFSCKKGDPMVLADDKLVTIW